MNRLRSVMAAEADTEARLMKVVRLIAGTMVADVCSVYRRTEDNRMELIATEGLREVMQHKRVATAAGGFGVLMGMIPGTGEFTAQFMSYTYAQKTSKNPDLFGKGSPEGLIASEAAIKAHGFETGNHGDYEPGRRFYFHDADGIEYEVVSYIR